MEILKKRRRVIRAQSTRIINEADDILAKQQAPDIAAVSGLIERLILVQKQLSDVNAAIEPHIIDNDADAEFEQLSMVNAILREKIKHVTTEDWRKSIQHVTDLEAKFRLDTSGSKHIQPIIIQLDEDGTEESDSDCELSGIEPLDEA
ncbi:hypothetical protein HPB50_012045 [Hyalomma asiaticum]|uniref:Uncharacterized protein n=1 Tax=Hyalomma asiaticum TaxID=266040 RepID=A0ACB7TJ81_HYAAI|nr:hypothetical protein HPB50_012045 [Hyalomma asiaticum]